MRERAREGEEFDKEISTPLCENGAEKLTLCNLVEFAGLGSPHCCVWAAGGSVVRVGRWPERYRPTDPTRRQSPTELRVMGIWDPFF